MAVVWLILMFCEELGLYAGRCKPHCTEGCPLLAKDDLAATRLLPTHPSPEVARLTLTAKMEVGRKQRALCHCQNEWSDIRLGTLASGEPCFFPQAFPILFAFAFKSKLRPPPDPPIAARNNEWACGDLACVCVRCSVRLTEEIHYAR